MEDLRTRAENIHARIEDLLVRLDFETRVSQLERLQKKAEDPELWDDPDEAKKVMRQFTRLKRDVDAWRELRQRATDLIELLELEDESLRTELESEVEQLEAEIERRETRALLSGEYDDSDAILAIHAGAGGTDSQDWAAMLQRMYLRWAESHDYATKILDLSEGEEAGIKSVTIALEGDYAYGYLKAEKGVHRLVRLSPFDSANRRHTSFALVEVLPEVESDDDLEINSNDLRIDTYRSAGAGGQNVQKNETAVRITHIPTGLVVTCQNERSQTQNKENAMKVLRARLLEIKEEQQAEELAEIKGDHVKAEWGSQIRSYVLHPYQMVKDHRTDVERGNTQAVLDGDLDDFIESYLRSTIGEKA
ncbi:MAG: peptide chain release factor 2 [Anaerolineales bacterium]